MPLPDDAIEARAQGWRTLAALHARIEGQLEHELQAEHGMSVSAYNVLDVLSQQDGWLLRMQQLANAVVLSQSATTRLVNRLEDQGLLARTICPDDRRGIYTQLTHAGWELLGRARPTHDAALATALAQASKLPEQVPLVRVLESDLGTGASTQTDAR